MKILPTETECDSEQVGKVEGDSFIPLSVPEIRGNEWTYVKDCLDTNWVSSVGAYVDRFEKAIAERVSRKHGVATVNGTAALHIALLVAGVEPGDEVLVSTLTFIAPANTIRYCGAHPVFMDADSQYWQMDPEKVRDFLENECVWKNGELRNKSTGRRVKAIMPVHILGHPCDLSPILEVARRYKLLVIEDASEGLGATYRGRPIGSVGDIACFSFNGNKVITAGGGGVIVTDCEAWAFRAKHLTTQAKSDPMEYVHDEVGYNYRMVNLLAALGCAQLEQLDVFIGRKRRIAERYRQGFAGLDGLQCMKTAEWADSIDWLFTVYVRRDAACDKQALLEGLNARGIQSRPLWRPLHQLPVYAKDVRHRIEVADMLYEGCLSLPCSVSLTDVEQERVMDAVCEVFSA